MDEGKLVAERYGGETVSEFGGKSLLIVETSKGKISIETDEAGQRNFRINEEDRILSLQMESPNLEKSISKHYRKTFKRLIMEQILNITRKDLRLLLLDKTSLIVTFALPIDFDCLDRERFFIVVSAQCGDYEL